LPPAYRDLSGAERTERIEVETESGVKGEFTYRLAPFDRTWSVTFE